MSGRPNPGSNEAVEDGCLCPIVENNYGQAEPDGDGMWWIDARCPVHPPRPDETDWSKFGQPDANGCGRCGHDIDRHVFSVTVGDLVVPVADHATICVGCPCGAWIAPFKANP